MVKVQKQPFSFYMRFKIRARHSIGLVGRVGAVTTLGRSALPRWLSRAWSATAALAWPLLAPGARSRRRCLCNRAVLPPAPPRCRTATHPVRRRSRCWCHRLTVMSTLLSAPLRHCWPSLRPPLPHEPCQSWMHVVVHCDCTCVTPRSHRPHPAKARPR